MPAIDETAFRNLISGHTRGCSAVVARALLRGASLAYRLAVSVRNRLYDCGLWTIHQALVPVISVGNLTTGGTGKTPVAALLCQRLAALGGRPGLISRGYRAAADGSNDEKRVLELLVPGTPHIQKPDRLAAVRELLQLPLDQRPDVVVMDDGFQHRRLHRDLNLVLIDATCPFGFNALLPRGLLREPATALRRADAVLLTRANLVSPAELMTIEQQLITCAPALENRILRVRFEPRSLRDLAGKRHDPEACREKEVFLMTAIGNPDAFRATCLAAGLKIVGQRWFPDHHHFTAADIDGVLMEATGKNADLVVTTVKDLVKLEGCSSRILALDIEAVLPRAEDAACLDRLLQTVMGGRR
ncbi:MAG: Tetraacyldisaccharide 4-kinase [Planctomycetota bacterium]